MINDKDSSLPQFHFIIGCHDIKKDKILCATHEDNQFFQMHQITVPTLTDINKEGKNLVERWEDRDNEKGKNRFIAYIEKDGVVCSMVSGRIVQNEAIVINTATRPEFRRKGYYKAVLANLVKELKENHKEIGFITASINSRTQVNNEIGDKLLEDINKLSNTIEFDDIKKDKKSSIYGNIIGKSVYASKEIGEQDKNALEFYNKLPDNPPYNNLASQKAMFGHALNSGTEVKPRIVKFDSRVESDLIFTPNVKISDRLYQYSSEEIVDFNKKRKESLGKKKKSLSLQSNAVKKNDCSIF